jgi:hypothetical protein
VNAEEKKVRDEITSAARAAAALEVPSEKRRARTTSAPATATQGKCGMTAEKGAGKSGGDSAEGEAKAKHAGSSKHSKGGSGIGGVAHPVYLVGHVIRGIVPFFRIYTPYVTFYQKFLDFFANLTGKKTNKVRPHISREISENL